eukprot:930617-Rhodomonas_salina.1
MRLVRRGTQTYVQSDMGQPKRPRHVPPYIRGTQPLPRSTMPDPSQYTLHQTLPSTGVRRRCA